MKILMINSVCGIRSTGRICTDLAITLEAQGYECKIAYGRDSVPEEYQKYAVRIGNELNVISNAIKCRLFDNDGFSTKKQTKKLLNWAEEYNPDELWIHNLHGYYINVKLLFEWIKSRPQMRVKWTLHDCWAFTGHCTHFVTIRCEKWKYQCSNCPQKHEYPMSLFLDCCKQNYERKRKAFTGIDDLTIITPSKWLAGLVKQSFLKEYAVEVHHNTIDQKIFCPTSSDFRKRYDMEKKIMILGVASVWSKKKGLEDFILLSKMLDDRYKVVLVGLTERQIKTIPKSIIAIQRTNNAKELAAIYTTADFFLNLSYEDTYPTVNIESQACGTPCITYDTGGSPESVPAYNVVKQGDLKGIVDLMKLRSEKLNVIQYNHK